MNFKLTCYINVLINFIMNKTKKLLNDLKNVFLSKDEIIDSTEVEVTQDEVVELTEDTVEDIIEETVSEDIELAETPSDEEKSDPEVEAPKVEYVTKLEFQEFQKTILELLEKALKPEESKKEVPQELSADVEEISHSPELQVEKKFDHLKPSGTRKETIEQRIYNQLFS